jgi:hypothetical protein
MYTQIRALLNYGVHCCSSFACVCTSESLKVDHAKIRPFCDRKFVWIEMSRISWYAHVAPHISSVLLFLTGFISVPYVPGVVEGSEQEVALCTPKNSIFRAPRSYSRSSKASIKSISV